MEKMAELVRDIEVEKRIIQGAAKLHAQPASSAAVQTERNEMSVTLGSGGRPAHDPLWRAHPHRLCLLL
jgi:hypothetical protein